MTPEIEAATALLEGWDGALEELAWTAELLLSVSGTHADRAQVRAVTALAEDVCRRARESGGGREIDLLEKAIARARVS